MEIEVSFQGTTNDDNPTWVSIKNVLNEYEWVPLPVVDIGEGTQTIAWFYTPEVMDAIDITERIERLNGVTSTNLLKLVRSIGG